MCVGGCILHCPIIDNKTLVNILQYLLLAVYIQFSEKYWAMYYIELLYSQKEKKRSRYRKSANVIVQKTLNTSANRFVI